MSKRMKSKQGNCRYGQSCRFEHIYGSKYSYHAPTHAQVDPQQTSVTDEQLANQVQSDVQAALRGGQWILSCYAPFKEKPILPGISDLSPEEARLFIYEAKANNNVDAAISFMNKQIQETRSKYEQLLQPSMSMMKVLRSLYNGESVQSPFTVQSQEFGITDNSATSIFRGAVQNTGFGQNTNANNSIFGQGQSNTVQGIYGNEPDPAKSIFASANQNVFGAAQPINIFQNPMQDTAMSIFSQANQNAFGAQQPCASVFSPPQQPFEQTPKPNVFGSRLFQISTDTDTSAQSNEMFYSKLEDLSPSDIEEYESPYFKLGFVPELPPPASLCKLYN